MKTNLNASLKSANEKEKTMDFIMTIEVPDRTGEIVDIETMSFENFMKNPVFLQFHEYDEPPIGKILEIRKTTNEQGIKQLECTVKFATDIYPVADLLWKLYYEKYMAGVSIGFRVGEYDYNTQTGVTTLKNCELLELSAVSVPANQLALAKSKGIDISPLKINFNAVDMAEVKESLITIKTLLETPKTSVKQHILPNKEDIKRSKVKNLAEKMLRELSR